MKQIIRDVEKCFECPFMEWDYDNKGDTYNYCDNPQLKNKDEFWLIQDIGGIPQWCPLPDKKD